MGGSVGKILGTVGGFILGGPVGAAIGAGLGHGAVDKPAADAEKAQALSERRIEAAANATQAQVGTGTGQVERKGASTLGEEEAKDKRGMVKKKKLGASKLRIEPLAATAATGTSTTGTTGLKV